MKPVRFGAAFRKDLNRIVRRRYDRARLDAVVDALRRGENLAPSARSHPLKGEWLGFWECHLTSDWLLIYKITGEAVVLARTGTHSDLFKS